jgi:dihydrofolate reductase
MSRLRFHSFAMSLDGYGTGPRQSLDNPLGAGGLALHEWAFNTRTFHKMYGKDGGSSGVDDDFVARGVDNIGAWIIGRNMFGPVRGPWPDDTWKGWGAKILRITLLSSCLHIIRGTTFNFVTDGIHAALARAREASQGKDIRLGGGVATIREYPRDGLVDELHLAYAPVFLGSGECLLEGMDLPALGYHVTSHITTLSVMHVLIAKKNP